MLSEKEKYYTIDALERLKCYIQFNYTAPNPEHYGIIDTIIKKINNESKELVIPIGPAGCGKSTYRMKNYSKYTLICPDLIRFKILDSENTKIYFDYEFESQVWKQVYILFDEAIKCGYNIYFDATNLTQKRRYPLVCRALRKGYKIHMIYFNIPLEVALERNTKRERKVPDEVIKEQFEKLEPPQLWEYDKLTIIY